MLLHYYDVNILYTYIREILLRLMTFKLLVFISFDVLKSIMINEILKYDFNFKILF